MLLLTITSRLSSGYVLSDRHEGGPPFSSMLICCLLFKKIDAIISASLSMTKPVHSSSLVYSILFCCCKGTPTKSLFFFDGNEVFLHPNHTSG